MQVVDMEVDDIEVILIAEHLIQHKDVVGDVVPRIRGQAQ
jgi:hypothetical protein